MILLSNGWMRWCAVIFGSCVLVGCTSSTSDDIGWRDAASGDAGKSDAAGGAGGARDSGVEAEASVGGSGGLLQGGAGGADASGGGGPSTGGSATGGGGLGGSGGSAGSGGSGENGGSAGTGGSAGSGGSAPNPCRDIAHIGDSLSAGQEPKITTAYSEQGMTVQIDAVGGRGILQSYPDVGNTGLVAAQRFLDKEFKGCWVVALGTNDTANIAAGANYSRASAIDKMMTKIDPNKKVPVMWVNTYTTKTSGYYANSNMILWNDELKTAKSRWPNMRVYDWAAVAETGAAPYYDGIHHTTAGQKVRHENVAKAAKELLLGP